MRTLFWARQSLRRPLILCCTLLGMAVGQGCGRVARPPIDAIDPVTYTVTIPERNSSVAKVNCTIVGGPDVELFMNNNCAPNLPGGHAAFVQNLTATDAAGNPVSMKDLGHARWKLKSSAGQPITISYNVVVEDDQSVWPYGPDEAPYVTEDGVFWTGRALFITTQMSDITVRFNLPRGWHVSTPWKPVSDQTSTFFVEDEKELTDAFFLAGTHAERRAKVGDTEIILALGGAMQQSSEVLQHTVQRFVDSYVELFGGSPRGRTLIVVNPYDQKGWLHGGVFGRSVSLLMSDKPENTNATRWAPFIAHELLHLWGGGAIKYAEQEYWFSEGFSNYYANVICARSGLMDEKEYIQRLRRASESYLENCGVTSIRRAGDAGSHNSALQYDGGSLVAAILDIRIRRLTNNAKCLDDLMHQMYEEFGMTGERYTIEDVVRIAGGVTGTEHSDFFGKYVLGTGELPLEEHFGCIGLDLDKEIGEVFPSRNYVIHGLLRIQSLTQTPEGLIVRRSQDAGYQDEDNLVAIDGEPVKTFRDLQVMAKQFSPGDKVEPSLLRGGKRITMELALGGEGKEPGIEREVKVSIRKKTELDSSQEALLSAILGGM